MSLLRVSAPVPIGRRGAGLGNELLPWGKAYLGARALGLTALPPRWHWSRYGYARMFGASLPSLLARDVQRAVLPSFRVTEALYRSTGAIPYGDAVAALADAHGLRARPALALLHEGMWGGYLAIEAARPYLLGRILSAPGVADAVASVGDGRAVVAVHARFGDFASSAPGPGEFNAALPVEWYTSVVAALREAEPRLRVVLLTDARDVSGLRESLGAEAPPPGNALTDLAVMATADLLVCSVSSFSMAAAFLSGAPYVWYRDQLTPVGDALSLWGGEPAQAAPSSPTSSALDADDVRLPRGVALSASSTVPDALATYLALRADLRSRERDLLRYGVVR